jgi:hypothetical protein
MVKHNIMFIKITNWDYVFLLNKNPIDIIIMHSLLLTRPIIWAIVCLIKEPKGFENKHSTKGIEICTGPFLARNM